MSCLPGLQSAASETEIPAPPAGAPATASRFIRRRTYTSALSIARTGHEDRGLLRARRRGKGPLELDRSFLPLGGHLLSSAETLASSCAVRVDERPPGVTPVAASSRRIRPDYGPRCADSDERAVACQGTTREYEWEYRPVSVSRSLLLLGAASDRARCSHFQLRQKPAATPLGLLIPRSQVRSLPGPFDTLEGCGNPHSSMGQV
jgi:hypothetical protein